MNRLVAIRNISRGLFSLPNTTGKIVQRRRFGGHGGGHGDHHGPHIPEFHDNLGKFCLVSAFLWIFYRAKENKGQIFGWYAPWLHEHEHLHLHYVEGGDVGDSMPTLSEADEHEDHEEENDDE